MSSNMYQRCNHGEIFGATSAIMGRICPPLVWNRVKVSESLGATAVAPFAPVDTSLLGNTNTEYTILITGIPIETAINVLS